MPLFATLMASAFSGLVGFFARFFALNLAQKLAAYAMYITVTVAMVASVLGCLHALVGMLASFSVGGGVSFSWVRYFFIGVGMFIPSNAAGVLSCLASVWILTSIYKVQKQGLHNYGS